MNIAGLTRDIKSAVETMRASIELSMHFDGLSEDLIRIVDHCNAIILECDKILDTMEGE